MPLLKNQIFAEILVSMVNILVTGGCGFIGSNFIKYILKIQKLE